MSGADRRDNMYRFCGNCKYYDEDMSCGTADCKMYDELTEEEADKYFTNDGVGCPKHKYIDEKEGE